MTDPSRRVDVTSGMLGNGLVDFECATEEATAGCACF